MYNYYNYDQVFKIKYACNYRKKEEETAWKQEKITQQNGNSRTENTVLKIFKLHRKGSVVT